MSRSRCPGRRPASAAIPIPGAEMPLMNSTGSPAPDSRTRTRTGGAAMLTQRSCTSSPFAAARRASVARSLVSTPTRKKPYAECRDRSSCVACQTPQPPLTALGAGLRFTMHARTRGPRSTGSRSDWTRDWTRELRHHQRLCGRCRIDNGRAEGVGFEPTETRASTVFKTVPFVRSGIPPKRPAYGARPTSGAGLHLVERRVRTEHVGDCEATVVRLVVLEEEHERERDGTGGAVQRVHESGLAVAAETGAEPARRVVEVVRARRELAIPALGGKPGLDVVLLRGGRAEVAGGDVHDAVRQFERGEDLLLDREDTFVLVPRFVGVRVAEHLDLVELVHAEQAAGVLAVGAGFAPEVRRHARVAERERVGGEDLVAVERGERDFAGADEEQLAAVDFVYLRAVGGEEPCFFHRVLAYEHGGRDRGEAPANDDVHHPLQQRELDED